MRRGRAGGGLEKKKRKERNHMPLMLCLAHSVVLSCFRGALVSTPPSTPWATKTRIRNFPKFSLFSNSASTWSELACPANQHPKSTIKKKPTNLCAPYEFIKQMCPPCLIIIQSCYFDYRILKQTFCLFSLLDLCFVLCPLDLDVLRAQRIIGSFNYPQIHQVGKSNHMVHSIPFL